MPGDHVDGMLAAWAARDPELDVAPLAVVGRILRAAAIVRRAIDAELTPLGVSFGDFDVLNTLRREAPLAGMHPTELARSALITSGAMTARLTRLERAGLVRRAGDPADRRAVRVHLTPRGDEVAAAAVRAVLRADRTFLAPLAATDRDVVADRLRALLLAAED